MFSMPEEQHRYSEDQATSLLADVPPPSYEMILDWMRASPSREVSFDIWARGNFLRRIINNIRQGTPPLIVPIRRTEEMRWAYRRLALLGLPVDFVYTGGVTRPKKILHLYPADGNVNEGGWGYIGALGSITKIQRRRWFPVIGYSQLMPRELLDWITNEASGAFLRGDVFVAPAELIGIDPSQPAPGTQLLEDVVLGRQLVQTAQTGEALMEIDLPFLDHMSPTAFEKFLADYENELARFRSAFRKIAVGVAERDLNEVTGELRSEIAELSQSDRYSSMRTDIGKLGGIITTLSATVAAFAGASWEPQTALPVAVVAGAAAATTSLIALWQQRVEREAKLRENPYYIVWKLGVDKPSRIQRSNISMKLRQYQQISDADLNKLSDFHWLCPPTPGLRFAAVQK